MHALLFEINTCCWLRELSEKSGRTTTLSNVPDSEFGQWQRLGFTHIWLMGVWTTGPHSRSAALSHPDQRRVYDEVLPGWTDADIGASPYSISAYTVSAELGGDAALSSFKKRLNEEGLKLILDFVPNHIGLDHPWLDEHPEYLVQCSCESPHALEWKTDRGTRWCAHGRDPYMPAWTDTVQIDYRVPEARAAMAAELASVAQRCDGVRCDMAMLVLEDVFAKTWSAFPLPEISNPKLQVLNREVSTGSTAQLLRRQGEVYYVENEKPGTSETELGVQSSSDFWSCVIPQIKAKQQGFLFLAEVYWGLEARLQSLGFDYTYDKALYDRLVSHDSVGAQKHLLGMGREVISRCAHFLENHDEPRISSFLNVPEHRVEAAVILTLPGMRFLHEGQLDGATRRIPVQMLRRPNQPLNAEIRLLYENLLTLLPHTFVGRGQCELLVPQAATPGNASGQDLVLLQWMSEGAEIDVVAINLANHRSQCFVPLKLPSSGRRNRKIQSLLGNSAPAVAKPDQQPGIYLDLAEWSFEVLRFS